MTNPSSTEKALTFKLNDDQQEALDIIVSTGDWFLLKEHIEFLVNQAHTATPRAPVPVKPTGRIHGHASDTISDKWYGTSAENQERRLAAQEAERKALEDVRRGLFPIRKLFENRKMRTGIDFTDSLIKGIEHILAAPPAEEETREQKAMRLVKESGKAIHASDCATSCAPAEEPGPCDCDIGQPAPAEEDAGASRPRSCEAANQRPLEPGNVEPERGSPDLLASGGALNPALAAERNQPSVISEHETGAERKYGND